MINQRILNFLSHAESEMTESRSLEVRCGIKKQNETRKNYVHMLNGTLCATERALCCIVENYQTPEVGVLLRPPPYLIYKIMSFIFRQGLRIPEALRPYMQNRDFIQYVRSDLPKGSTSTKKK